MARQPEPQDVGVRTCSTCGKLRDDSWSGHKTCALKPAWEPVLCFRAPANGKTYAELALESGSGCLNVDAGRVEGTKGDGVWGTSNETCAPTFNASPEKHEFRSAAHDLGRYPANVALECICPPERGAATHPDPECPSAQLDEQSGQQTSGAMKREVDGYEGDSVTGFIRGRSGPSNQHGDTGGASRYFFQAHPNPDCPAAQLDEQSGDCSSTRANGVERGRTVGTASRFFYTAKASASERNQGLYGMEFTMTARLRWPDAAKRACAAGSAGSGSTAGRRAPAPSQTSNRLRSSKRSFIHKGEFAMLIRHGKHGPEARLLAVTGLSPQKVTGESTIQSGDGSAWSMCWCGSLSTDPFHPDTMCIIETAISSTTTSPTLNYSEKLHTNGCMAVVFGEMVSGGNLAESAMNSSPWARKTGISPKRDTRSTGDANLATSVSSWLRSKPESGGGRRVSAVNTHPT